MGDLVGGWKEKMGEVGQSVHPGTVLKVCVLEAWIVRPLLIFAPCQSRANSD